MRKMNIFLAFIAFAALSATAQTRVGERHLSPQQYKVINHGTAAVALRTVAAAPTGKAAADDLITTQPEGTLYHNAIRHSRGYFVVGTDQQSAAYYLEMDGLANDFVVANDGTVYLKDPFSGYATGTWLKADKAAGDTVEMKLPQKVFEEDYQGEHYNYYAYRLVPGDSITPDGRTVKTYFPDKTSQTVKFVWRNDSLIKTGNELLGMTNEWRQWVGFGDDETDITPFNGTASTPPADAKIEKYYMHFTQNGAADVRTVNVVKQDKDIFIGNLSQEQPNAWIKGTVTDGKATFAPDQYLGFMEEELVYTFFVNLKKEKVWSQTSGSYMDSLYVDHLNPLTFNIDEATGVLSSDGTIGICQGTRSTSFVYIFDTPSLEKTNDVSIVPSTPQITEFAPFDEEYGNGAFIFLQKATGVNGEPLDKTQLFYNVYFDSNLKTFTPDEYTALTEPMTDVPYDFSDGLDFEAMGDEHMVYFYEKNFTKLGVQAVYKGGGEITRSPIFYVTPSGIAGTYSEDAGVASTEYFDLTGRRVSGKTKGLKIKKSFMKDGTVKTEKTFEH